MNVEEFEIRFKRYNEYKKRIEWQEYKKKENEAVEKAKLMELMKKYPGLYSELAKELCSAEF